MPVGAKQILSEIEEAVIAWRTVGTTLGMTAVELGQFAEDFAIAG